MLSIPSPPLPLDKNIYPGAALIATGLATSGLRKGSLSPSGATAAWFAGYAHLANPLKVFGVAMIVFYLVGSRATKVKADVKATLEDGPDPSKPSGNRNWVQVFSNSLPSIIAAVVYRLYATPDPTVPLLAQVFPRRLIYATLGHFATCLGDTLASELGILSRHKPVHVLTLSEVPPGTNGAVSRLGLGVSVAGGVVMAVTMLVDLLVEDQSFRSAGTDGAILAGGVLAWGTFAGLAGSLLDSLLGATLQRTLYDTKTGRILTDHSAPPTAESTGIIQIGPGINVLSNSAVNFVCGCAMAGVGWWVGGW